jgi:ribosomal protein S18 acetylase RimI-like enzyme
MITFLEPTISRASSDERALLVDVITRAFAADPPSRWLYPDDREYWRFFPRFVEVFGGSAIDYGTADMAADAGAAALWLPPGAHPDEAALGALLEESVDPARIETAFSLFERMAGHHPAGPHWYLPLIGVAPGYQGRGHGSRLLEYAVARCDRDHLPAYLESTSPRSVPLYRRHGFEVIAEIREGSAPSIFPMVRKPRDPQILKS